MLNENLVKVRKERGLTQEALALKLNVVRQTVSKWEKGTAVPDADTLCRIADALDVSVSVLLGDTAHGDRTDTDSVTKALAQINEQLAVRNRRAANAWKVVCLISLIVIGFLIGKTCFGNGSANSETLLPDVIEASSVSFNCTGKELSCSFVPSFGDDGAVYTVALFTVGDSIPAVTAVSKYESGVCTAVFDKSKLFENLEYRAVLTVDCNGEVRNLTLADVTVYSDNTCSWT